MQISRKDFLALGLGGAIAALSSTKADAQLVQRPQNWSPTELHGIMNRTAKYRQVYDITQIGNGVFLNNIKNSLNGFQFSFGAQPSEINIVAALHGAANLLNFDDAMWKKYRLGEFIKMKDLKTGGFATRNLYYHSSADKADHNPDSEKSIYQDKSIEGLQARGVHFFCCHTATEEQSRKLIARFGLKEKPETIVKDLLNHRIPGTTVVPAMVATVAILQLDAHFSYITVAG
ncbi:MAG: hypothetical protein P8Z30_09830 [Acidobacteriota bacterium]